MKQKMTAYMDKTPLSIQLYTFFFLIFIIALSIILVYGPYGKQEIIKGIIRDSSYHYVSATNVGNVDEIYIQKDQYVSKGDPLIKVSLLREDTQKITLQLIEIQEKYQKKELIYTHQLANIRQQKKHYLDQYNNTMELLDNLEKNYKNKRDRYTAQLNKYMDLSSTLNTHKTDIKKVQKVLNNLNIAINKLSMRRNEITQEKSNQELYFSRTESEIIQNRKYLNKRLRNLLSKFDNIQSQQEYIIHSPVDAFIHDVTVSKGDFVDKNIPSIILKKKNNDSTRAELFLTADQLTLLNNHQQLFLRVDSLPYQDYGKLSAFVVNTPIQLSSDKPEPLFKVQLRLDEQDQHRKISLTQLKDGMSITATLHQPKPSLLEWFITPINHIFKRNPDFIKTKFL